MPQNYTQQEVRAAVKTIVGGGDRQFNEDFHKLCDNYGIASGQLNERLGILTGRSSIQNAWEYLQQYGALGITFREPDSSGGFFDSATPALNSQTFNMPATEPSSAGDPIGLMLPAQAPESLTNRLIWTDGFSTTSAWTATNVSVTPNTKNDSGVGNTDSASPVADTLNATVAGGSISQSYTCTADTAVRTATADLEAGTATNSTVELEYTGGNTYIAQVVWSGGVPTVTNGGSAGASDVGAELQASGIYKIRVRGANDGRSTALIRIKPAAGGTGTVYASRAQVNDGSTVLDYQPNAGCLGGSNRRSGGANRILWSQDPANPGWTRTGITSVSDAGLVTLSAGSSIHRIYPAAMVTLASSQHTVWFDVSYTNHQFLQIYGQGITPGHINYDLVNGTLSATTFTGTITANGTNRWIISCTYTANGDGAFPLLLAVTSLSAARAETWSAVGTETFQLHRAFCQTGTSIGTYTCNMGVLGGLITNVPLYQTTSGNRPLLARFPKTGIRNRLTNNMMTGAVSGGAAPTGWSGTIGVTGLTAAYTYGTTDDGFPYMEIAVSGTAGTSSPALLYMGSTSGSTAAATGQVWSHSVYAELRSGSFANVTTLALQLRGYSGGSFVNTTGTLSLLAATNTPQRLSTDNITISMSIDSLTDSIRAVYVNGGAVNFTLRIYLPQLEQSAATTAVQQVVSASDITESGVGYNYLPLYDGVSDFMTLGMQSWGTAQLQAAAQYAFTIFFVFRTVSANAGGIISQNNGAATAAQMFSLYVSSATGVMALNARGIQATTWGGDLRDGVFHVGALRWNGTSFDQILDGGALTAVTWAGSTAIATAIDIAVGIERVSTSARPFNGHLGVAFIDRACTDAEMLSAVQSLNTTYRAGL